MDLDRHGFPGARLALLVACSCLACGAACIAAEQHARLLVGQFRIESPIGAFEGPLVALVGFRASWRFDVGIDSDPTQEAAERVLQRRGEGWTMAGGRDTGFSQAWHRPWQRLSRPAARAAGELLHRLADGPGAHPGAASEGARRWRPAARLQDESIVVGDLWELAAMPPQNARIGQHDRIGAGELRRGLVFRGRGQGGDGLVLRLRWTPSSLMIYSRRWAASLMITTADHGLVQMPPDAFLPLWPLADFLP